MPQSKPILGLLCALVLAVLPGRAQEPAQPTAPPKIDGTWVLLIEGHQVGLELEGTIDLPRGPSPWTAERLKKP